ncbi:MAG: hypothetical protein IH984_04620 [Planctomycetes bacterium]|nr:hypothetical protein [Planctomycetota bacterium]
MTENDQERQGTAKSEADHLTKRVALYIAFHYLLPVLLVVTLALALFAIFFWWWWNVQSIGVSREAALSWFSVAVSVVIINSILLVFLNREAKGTLRQIEKSSSDHYEELQRYIREKLSPSIHVLNGKKAIRQEATVLLEGAPEEKVDQARYITYFGAASLGPTPEEELAFKEGEVEDVDNHPAVTFKGAFYKALAAPEPVRVDRYLQLFSLEAFRDRSESQRSDYIRWLTKEIGLLKTHRWYTLWDSKRALPFGSTRSTIVTRQGFLDIIGTSKDDKLSGVLVRGPEIAKLIHDRTIDFLEAAKKKENLPRDIGQCQPERLLKLENDYKKRIEEIHKTKRAEERRGAGQ